jgi:hypothetical protein
VDGTANAVPEDHPDPVEVYTVAVPIVPVAASLLFGSPTTAVDPFAEIATDVPKALEPAGRVRESYVLSVEPL